MVVSAFVVSTPVLCAWIHGVSKKFHRDSECIQLDLEKSKPTV